MNKITLVFPHQLFNNSPAVDAIGSVGKVYLIEEDLFFNQYRFHKQKIAFHRASMKYYQFYMAQKKYQVEYVDSFDEISDIRKFIPHLKQKGVEEIHFVEPADFWLEKRIKQTAEANDLKIFEYNSPMFFNNKEELRQYFDKKKKLRQTEFYIRERNLRKILLDENSGPAGGKWTYDAENRLKYPKGKSPPPVVFPQRNKFYREALEYTEKYFADNPGLIDPVFTYPTTFDESLKWLQQFLEHRFKEFGPYEDAMIRNQHILNHSLLSPLLNSCLLTPVEVTEKTLDFFLQNKIPLNSCEGFIRQLIGWREFIRGVYFFRGVEQRSKNFWNFSKQIPSAFYEGNTGIDPVDSVIRKVIKTGYCHHIERLMILGNFMLLCEFNPHEVYRWFMEMFIDAYDWVMVPNVYGMSQFADGGLMATKPYISGSNYIMKMSDYPKGEWQLIWDALFWRFMHVHRDFFLKNHRLSLLVHAFDKMPPEKQEILINRGENYLNRIYS